MGGSRRPARRWRYRGLAEASRRLTPNLVGTQPGESFVGGGERNEALVVAALREALEAHGCGLSFSPCRPTRRPGCIVEYPANHLSRSESASNSNVQLADDLP